jgi:2-polyprenyl-3-methyl-5-hydroxy-6-metoxy-1,4-benzoquinol methylase
MASVYDRVHPHMRNSYEQWLQTSDIRRMLGLIEQMGRSARVLELGCGTGNLTMQFLETGAEVTAVDMSAEMLSVLSAKLARSPHGVRCKVLEIDADGFLLGSSDASFDLIAMSSVAHHLPDYLGSTVHLAHLISPGGFLYLIHEPAHKTELTAAPLRRLWSIVPRATDRLLRRTRMDIALHRNWEQQDTRYADYHYHQQGIGIAAITQAVAPCGLRLFDASRYNAHETSFVSWLDNYWCARVRYEQFQRTYFRAIWRRDLEPA